MIENNILKKKVVINDMGRKVVVLPIHLVNEILYSMHDDITSGHLGCDKTFDKISTNYFWPGMRADIKQYVDSCETCQMRKRSKNNKLGHLNPIDISSPFHMMGIDFVGPLTETYSGNKHVIVCVDYFTKFAVTKAVRSATAEAIADFFVEEIVLRYGAPVKLLSDRGTQFTSNLNKEIFKLLNVKHLKTTAFYPACNGLTERLNQTIISMLSMYVSHNKKDWDLILPYVTFGYNSSVQSSTKFSPNELVFGRNPLLPTDINLGVRNESYQDVNAYTDIIGDRFKIIHDMAKSNNRSAAIKNKEYYDKKRSDKQFSVGDIVLLQKGSTRLNKIDTRYVGPYEIVEVISPVNYRIVRIDNRNKVEVVHISRLKLFKQRKYVELPVVSIDSDTDSVENECDVNMRECEVRLERMDMDEFNGNRDVRRSGRVRRKPDRLGYN